MNKLIFLYITNNSVEGAKKIAMHLLKKRMIGCANIFPIFSMYWWEEKIEDGNEVVLIVKTTSDRFEKVRDEVARIHPADIPCILKIDVESNEKYLRWIESELK